jgi:hypothetical protein
MGDHIGAAVVVRPPTVREGELRYALDGVAPPAGQRR